MKYQIELSEEQMILVANCLEDVSRFASGQIELKNTIIEMIKDMPFEKRIKKRSKVESFLEKVKKVLLPDLSENEAKKYNATPFIGNTYQIYRTILHQLAKDNNWNNVYSYPALPSGNLGTIKINKVDD